MNSSKQLILGRIRSALKDVSGVEPEKKSSASRDYRQEGALSVKKMTALFAERMSDYRAEVSVIKKADLPRHIAKVCLSQNVSRLVIPTGFPVDWLPEKESGIEYLPDGGMPLTHRELDESHGVLTSCTLAVAQTGSIVLDGGDGQGRRVLTLLPDFHLCVVFARQIVEIVPEAFAKLEERVKTAGSPVTFISGPSATSDIELDRVEGVHGPRRLHILLVEQDNLPA